MKELIGSDFELGTASNKTATTTISGTRKQQQQRRRRRRSFDSSDEDTDDENVETDGTTKEDRDESNERSAAAAIDASAARSTMDAFAAELLAQVNVTPPPEKLPVPSPPPSDALARLEAKSRECDFYKHQNMMLISRIGGGGAGAVTERATTDDNGDSIELAEKLRMANETNERLRAQIGELSRRNSGSAGALQGSGGVLAPSSATTTALSESLSSVQAERDSLLLEVGMLRSRYDPQGDGGKSFPRRVMLQTRGVQTGEDENIARLQELLRAVGSRCIFMEESRDLAQGQMAHMQMQCSALRTQVRDLQDKLGRLEYLDVLRTQKASTMPLTETPNVENMRDVYFTRILQRHDDTQKRKLGGNEGKNYEDGVIAAAAPSADEMRGSFAGAPVASGKSGVRRRLRSEIGGDNGNDVDTRTHTFDAATSRKEPGGPTFARLGDSDADEYGADVVGQEEEMEEEEATTAEETGAKVEDAELDQFADLFLSTPAPVGRDEGKYMSNESSSARLARAGLVSQMPGMDPAASKKKKSSSRRKKKSSSTDAKEQTASDPGAPAVAADSVTNISSSSDGAALNRSTRRSLKSLKTVAAIDERLGEIQARRARVLQSLLIEDAAVVAREELEEADLVKRRKKLAKREKEAANAAVPLGGV